ncbi:hypothetical protein KDM41_03825, partial [bacterium]|nr:hypothetical protein [bacterium]
MTRFRPVPFVLAALLLAAALAGAQPVGEQLAPDLARFHASAEARDAAPPSLSVTRPLPEPTS